MWGIREIEGEDALHRLAELAELMHAESDMNKHVLDLERILYVVQYMAAQPDAYVRGLYNDGEMVGFMVGEVQTHIFLDLKQAVDYAFYIRPASRSGTGAARLIHDFETWARERGAKRLQLGATAGVDNAKASAFLAAVGVPHYGAVHAKELT